MLANVVNVADIVDVADVVDVVDVTNVVDVAYNGPEELFTADRRNGNSTKAGSLC